MTVMAVLMRDICRLDSASVMFGTLRVRGVTGSGFLTRDPTRPDPAKIADPVTRNPETGFHISARCDVRYSDEMLI